MRDLAGPGVEPTPTALAGGFLTTEPPVVKSLGRVRLFATAWTAAHQASLSITNS